MLNIDKRFLAKEPDWTDSVYAAKMMLIYAASEIQKRILEDAPSFFSKHLAYFKDKYPSYFKNSLDVAEDCQNIIAAKDKIIERI